MSKTLKQLRETAEAILADGVSNKAALADALPLLIDFQNALESARRMAKVCNEIAAQLSDACSGYALAHPSVFDEDLTDVGRGVRNGDVTIGTTKYHFTNGYGEPKRINGDALSQNFLSALPEGWTKTTLKLDTTGINRLKVGDEELKEAGLYRPVKNEWK